MTTFADIVDAAEHLSLEEQQTLLQVLQQRIARQNRERLVEDVRDARDEFAQGKCDLLSPEEIMTEVRK